LLSRIVDLALGRTDPTSGAHSKTPDGNMANRRPFDYQCDWREKSLKPRIDGERLGVCIVAAVLIVSLVVAFASVALASKYVYIGLFGTLTASAYLGFRKHDKGSLSGLNSKRLWMGESSVFFVLLTVSALSLRSTLDANYRSLTHFATASLLFVVVSLEVVSLPKGRAFEVATLAQALVGSFWVRVAPQLVSSGVIGIDSWFHAGVVREIAESGVIPLDNIYHGLPNFHILVVAFGYVGGSQDLQFLEILGPVVGVVGCVFTYLIGRWLAGERAALLGAVFYGVGGYVVAMDLSFLAFALGATMLLASFYLCLRYVDTRLVATLLLAIVVMVALIGTHTVMAVTLLVMLAILWFARRAVPLLQGLTGSAEYKFPATLVAFFGVALFGWWAYVSESLFDLAGLIRWGLGFEPFSPAPASFPFLAHIPDSEYVLNLMVFLAPLGLAFIGTVAFLSKPGQVSAKIGCLGAIWALATVGLTSSVPQLIGLLGLRWNLAFQLFSGPLAGLGLLWIVRLPQHRSLVVVLVIVIMAPTAFVSISSPAGDLDTNILSPNTFVRLSLTEAEIESLTHIGSMHPSALYALFPDKSYFDYYAHIRAVDLAPFLATSSTGNITSGVIVLGSSASIPVVYYRQTTVNLKYNPQSTLGAGFSKIYDSGLVSAFEGGGFG